MSFGFSIGDFIAVIEHANKLRKNFVGAPAQFKALSDEVRNIAIVVQDVEVELSNTTLSSQQQGDLRDIAASCSNVLAEVEAVIYQYYELNSQKNGIKKVWKRLKWEPDEVRDLRNRICSNISLLNAINGSITRHNVLELVKYQNDEQRQVCLGWLSQAIYATQQYDYINRRQPGTGAWVLESPEFQTWIEKSPQTMFCPGIPGAGKTILASIVVDELESRCGNKSDVGIAYIFCSFQRHDDQSQKLESLMASIVRQLAQGLSPLPEIIESLHEKHRIKGTRPSVHEISIALRFIIGRFSRLFIIVDALDECHNLTISQLLNVIFDLQATENLNFLATSRFIPDIVTMFQNMPTLEIRAAKVDVMEYLVSNLHKLPLFVSRDPQLQQDIVTSITNSVDGMFLLAQLYLDSLVGKRSPRAIKLQLNDLISGSKTYDSAYDNVMHRINGQVTDLKIMALDVLAWITCAKRPLTTVELRHALAIEPDESEFNEDNISDLDDIVSVCAGLVTVTPDASGDIIRLVHYTAQEYFERSWSRWFPDAHSNIATACVTYLSFDAFQTGICLTDADFEARLDEYPLYSYAAKYWGNHAREQPLDESVMMSLLENTPKLHACVQGIFALRSYSSYGEYSLRVPLGFTGSHLAAYFGLISAVRSITSQCDQSYMVDSMGRTPLTWAAYNGHHAVVKFYLENGVNASEMDGDGRTPLSLAASMGWFNVVSLLLEYHVDPDVRDIDDQTALSWAAYQGHVEVAQLLLQKGASPDSRDANGQTQLSWAASNGCVGIVELLLDHCVDVESQDTSGRTPLSWAAENGHAAVIQILLDKGAVPDSNDVEGYTPLSRAAQYGHQTAICLLQEKPHSPRLHIPIMDGVDCVMQNTERPLTQFSPGENLQLPLESGKVTLDKQKPKPKPAFKCSLCLGPPSWMGNSRATFKRHLDNRHFPRFSHFCFEPSCSEDGNPQPLSHRMDLCFIHFERQHKKKLNREDIERLRHENPYPENCPVCQRSIGSWKDFYSCVFDHSKIMSPPS